MIKKLLIANRGEIAVRVIRGARELGIRTVAVFSEADRHSMHVALADEAVCLGEPEPSHSYLSIEKVIAAAKDTGADAIHPGYGFLSERAEFAEACEAAGLIFVGPSGAAMRILGSKIDAKTLAVSAGVPVTLGYFEPGASAETLLAESEKIGFPVMLKASAGGGGRGMRIVREAAHFTQEFAIASDEALKAFGDGAMMVEKLVERPRHVELQALVDKHGNVAVLFERECSIQRRHQKLIEEAPAPAYEKHPDLWGRMREAAVNLLTAARYQNAGTLEFLVDDASGEFYFMEVNARLQVEHPVTEMVTGLDLVQWQLRVAQGEELPPHVTQAGREALNGHAIEVRIVAEDPAQNFLPSVGKIKAWVEPKMPGVRVDTGYGPGAEVSRYYDSLLAKVIAHAATREEAMVRLEGALMDFHVLGVKTNIEYLLAILRHPKFKDRQFDTGFLGREFPEWKASSEVPQELAAIAQCAAQASAAPSTNGSPLPTGPWLSDGFRNVARSKTD
jgi:3-methylcrotonyl-CoA carboxylase alpha subunit